jgi:predicted N-acetyltransferase YhbS
VAADIRRMALDDVNAAIAAAHDAFRELATRSGHTWTPPDERRTVHLRRRHMHLLDTDPDGQWVAVDEAGEVVGVASALRREGLWGLSLLAVRPRAQGTGIGRRLLEQALRTYDGASSGLILSSSDPSAIRRYARAGFALAPTLSAEGRVRRADLQAPSSVREGDTDDLPLTERVDRQVRGVPHGGDIAVLLASGNRLLVTERGYAVVGEDQLVLLAATDEGGAADLLTASLLAVQEDVDVHVYFLTGAQQWAMPVLLDAGLALRPDGPVCYRGAVGPLAPYIPSGAYL